MSTNDIQKIVSGWFQDESGSHQEGENEWFPGRIKRMESATNQQQQQNEANPHDLIEDKRQEEAYNILDEEALLTENAEQKKEYCASSSTQTQELINEPIKILEAVATVDIEDKKEDEHLPTVQELNERIRTLEAENFRLSKKLQIQESRISESLCFALRATMAALPTNTPFMDSGSVHLRNASYNPTPGIHVDLFEQARKETLWLLESDSFSRWVLEPSHWSTTSNIPPLFCQVLESPELRKSFRDFLKREFAVNNLDFVDEVSTFTLLKQPGHLRAQARHIWNEFLAENAEREVNLPYKILSKIKEKIQERKLTDITTVTQTIIFSRKFPSPKVFSWLFYPSNRLLEAILPSEVKLLGTGPFFGIDISLKGHLCEIRDCTIFWCAFAPPPSNPCLESTIMRINTHAPRISKELVTHIMDICKNCGLNVVGSDGQSLLHSACTIGNEELSDWLLSKKVNLNILDNHRWTPLLCAIHAGHFKIALKLLDSGADATVITESGTGALHYLCRHPESDLFHQLFQRLVKEGVFARTFSLLHSTHADTPLISACRCGNKLAVKLLLSLSDTDLDCTSPEGYTPLHWAIMRSDLDIIKLLLEAGADPHFRPSESVGTPLELAFKKGIPLE